MSWWACVFLVSVAAAQQSGPPPEALAVLEGHVVSDATGEPVRKAHVTLGSRADQDSELVATTDENGHFWFAEVKPGTYTLIADKGGFLPGGYSQVKVSDLQTLLKISAGDRMQNLTLRLFPAGVISGRVLDADGDPAPGYEVVLWTQHRRRKAEPNSPSDQTSTNQAGEYRFDGLLPGTYYVSASRDSSGYSVPQIPVDSEGKVTRVHDLKTFYPSAISIGDAQSVRIQSGHDQAGVDIRIQRGPTLSVKGRIAGFDGSPKDYQLSGGVEEGLGWTSETGKILPNGDFAFDELPPGKHRLTLLANGPSGFRQIGVSEVNLIDQDVTGVVITPFKPAQVRVRVVLEGEEDKPLTAGTVSLHPVEGKAAASFQRMQFQPQNGTYILNDVPPGRYSVSFNNATNYYLKTVTSGARMLDPESIDVADGASLDLLMTFSKNVASLSGDVEVSQDQPKNSVKVVLISEDSTPSGDKIRPAELDQSLHFSIERLRPGKYVAFAAQEDDFDVWADADFLRLLQSQGSELELHEKEHATVHLKLIPKDVTDRIRQQLGL